jgi:hypothetical protein
MDEAGEPQPDSDFGNIFKSVNTQPISSIAGKKQKKFSDALVARINNLNQELTSVEKQDSINGRLKRLAATLAVIDAVGNEILILDIMALLGKWDGWTRVDVLNTLIRQGIRLDMAAVERVLNPTIQQLLNGRIHLDQQAAWLLKRCLLLFARINDPRAVEVIKEIASKYLRAYDMRDLIVALGESKSREAARYLIELAQNETIFKICAPEIIKALANSPSPEGRKALLSIIDPKIIDTKLPHTTDYHTIETLAQCIADICPQDKEISDRVFALCEEQLPDATREIAATIILKLSTPEAVIKGFNLISDTSRSPVPYSLWRALENVILNHVPVSGSPGSYQLEPRDASECRSRLFDMAMDDENRNRSAFELLGAIDQLRLEYGRPVTEPRHPNFKRGESWPIMRFIE